MCSNRIHFYERIECAFYLELEKVVNGKWTEWYCDGQKIQEEEYLNGKQNAKQTYLNQNEENYQNRKNAQ